MNLTGCLTVPGLSWVVGDAEELPFADDQFDHYTIAFGIRNVTHIEQVHVISTLFKTSPEIYIKEACFAM